MARSAIPREAMRALLVLADEYQGRADALNGPGLPVGATATDEQRRADAVWEFMRHLQRGWTPDEARTAALDALHEWIKRHNARRPDDVNWQRYAGRFRVNAPRWDSPPDGADAVDAAYGIVARRLVAYPVPVRAGCFNCWIEGVQRERRPDVCEGVAAP